MPLKYRDGNDTYIVEQYYEDVDFGASFGATGISNTAGFELKGPAGGWIFYAKPSYSYDATGPFSEANGGKPWRYLELSPNYTDSATGGSTAGIMWWGRREITTGAFYGDDGYIATGAPVALSTDGLGLQNSYRMWAVNVNRSYYNAYSPIEATNAVAYCFGLYAGGYSDWYLPSRGEMYYIWWNLVSDRDSAVNDGRGANTHLASKGFDSPSYWSSNEHSTNSIYAWTQSFLHGTQSNVVFKNLSFNQDQAHGRVRAVRRF